jgi:chitodextrinase
VFADDLLVASVPGDVLSYRLGSLAPALTYRLRVEAVDATGNSTTRGPAAVVRTTGTPDTVPPQPGATVSVRPGSVGTTWLRLDWAAASDNYGVAAYRLFADGRPIVTVPATTLTYVVPRLQPQTTYTFTVIAVDASGNQAPYPVTATATTLPVS